MRTFDYASGLGADLFDEKFVARFKSKIEQHGQHSCWPWLGAADRCSLGYGRITFRGANLYAHRVSWSLANGRIPTGHVIRHSCDNPACCNPRHLVNGLQADNVDDMNAKGRGRRKLTELQVVEIDMLARDNPGHWSEARLADRFSVSPTAVRRVLSGATWGKVTGRKTKANKPRSTKPERNIITTEQRAAP